MYDLNKYKLLWSVVDSIKKYSFEKEFEKVKTILLTSFNITTIVQYEKEKEEVYSLINKNFDNKDDIDMEFQYSEKYITMIYFIIGKGKEEVEKVLNNDIKPIEYYNQNKINDSFQYISPYPEDYSELLMKDMIIQEIENSRNVINILNSSTTLHPEYVKSIEEKVRYFNDYFKKILKDQEVVYDKKILKDQEVVYDKKIFNEKFKEFQDFYIHANDYIARINNTSRSDASNMLVGWIYPNIIGEYCNIKKYQKCNIDLSMYETEYIENW